MQSPSPIQILRNLFTTFVVALVAAFVYETIGKEITSVREVQWMQIIC